MSAASLAAPDGRLLAACLAASFVAHAALFSAGWLSHALERPVEVEFDLTAGAVLGPKAPGRAAAPAPRPAAAPPPESWTASPAGAAPAAPPAEAEPAAAPAAGGGAGAGDGPAGGSGLTSLPVLLNLRELGRLLERYYPEAERRAGHEGLVMLDLSLDEEGHVVGVEVVSSSDKAFEPAARQVAARLRYSPARAGERRVTVKLRQPVQFRLSGR